MISWEWMLNPKAYAHSIATHPPLGVATLLLLSLTAFWALSQCGMEFYLRRNFETAKARSSRLSGWFVGMPLAIVGAWLLLTFVSVGIARWGGHTLSFEGLFCLMVIAGLPQGVTCLAYPLRETAVNGLYIWRALASLLLLITTLHVVGTLSAADHLSEGQSLLVGSPFLLALWALNCWQIAAGPNTLRAAFRWRRAVGKRVVLFYPSGNVGADAQRLAWDADLLVAQIERLLDVPPVLLPIQLFLCSDSEEFRRMSTVSERCSKRYGDAGYILGLYRPWSHIRAIVARKLTETIVKQRLPGDLMPLLETGLTEYGAARTVDDQTRAEICLSLPLTTLAHNGVFYESYAVEESVHSPSEVKAHAVALVDYLIGRYGLDKFKEFCRKTTYDANLNRAAQLHAAVQSVYGPSATQLEQAWRREWIGPGQIERQVDPSHSKNVGHQDA